MSTDRIQKLELKKAQIEAQLKAARARDKAQKRKDDTRRKIIAGALALEHAEKNPDSEFTRTILRLIQHSVTTARDRELFDLDPLPTNAPPPDIQPRSGQASRLWKRITG